MNATIGERDAAVTLPIEGQVAVQKILHHLGLPAEPPEPAPARAPPRRSVHFVRS